MKHILIALSVVLLSACSTTKVVLPEETFKPELTQMCSPVLAEMKGVDGKAVFITLQAWHEEYRRCEALNNSKASYMLKLQELVKKQNSLITF
jgi:hypothetical protein